MNMTNETMPKHDPAITIVSNQRRANHRLSALVSAALRVNEDRWAQFIEGQGIALRDVPRLTQEIERRTSPAYVRRHMGWWYQLEDACQEEQEQREYAAGFRLAQMELTRQGRTIEYYGRNDTSRPLQSYYEFLGLGAPLPF
jgi:hypothetical protein